MFLYFRLFKEAPLIVAANRDERYERPSSPPRRLRQNPSVWGGQDLLAGGTWMGVNQFGLWAGIANRLGRTPDDPRRRSRGLLLLDLLTCLTCRDAERFVRQIPAARHNPFHLIAADRQGGFVFSYDHTGVLNKLVPGIHILTNLGFDQEKDLRRKRILQSPSLRKSSLHFPARKELEKILKDHGETKEDAICVHHERGGTRSGTLLYLRNPFAASEYYFADGPPCTAGFRNVSGLLKQE
jgi:uncharacterized protein with NRDE domain